MSPALTFLAGLLILGLFGWYFATEFARNKRWLGLTLTVFLVALGAAIVYPPAKKIHLGLDLAGGTEFIIRLVRDGKDPISDKAADNAVEVIRSRVDRYGVGEPVISRLGSDQIQVQIPGLDPDHIKEVRETLQRVAKLEFKLLYPNQGLISQIEANQAITPPGYQILEGEDEHAETLAAKPTPGQKAATPPKVMRKYLLKTRPDMLGDTVRGARAGLGTQGWEVDLSFNGAGAKQFGELTAAHVGENLAIVLDNQVISAPTLRSAIYGGNAQITGQFTEAQARNLSSALENPLATPVKIDNERSVSATLGKEAIRSGIISGLVGLALTFAFVLGYYRFAGLLASLALLINVVLLFGMMVSFNFVLTLPGIAGIILTIGLAIDANVLIYERLREELAAGKALRPALEGAYSKAFTSIFDANVTTLITSVILFIYAAGPVKGFAVALTLGIISALFSALIATRTGFLWATDKFGLQKIHLMHFFESPNFDFMGKAKACLAVSCLVIALSIGVFAVRGQKNFGIDFKGGDLTVLSTTSKLETGAVRDALKPVHLEESTIQSEVRTIPGTTTTQQLLTLRTPENKGVTAQETLAKAFPRAGVHQEQYEKVGALVGKQLAYKSLLALGLAVVGIMIYVSLRFEFAFAVGAIVALLHDVLITIGVFALLEKELTLVMVGAVLTIAGYSINDTIVVYDRIRSGLREGRKGSVREIMNASINETLSRTLLTGGMTLVTVLALYVGGGPVLNDFALAILIGVLVGTYSSVFVASPIVLWLSRGQKDKLRAEMQPMRGPAGHNASGAPLGPATPNANPLPVGNVNKGRL